MIKTYSLICLAKNGNLYEVRLDSSSFDSVEEQAKSLGLNPVQINLFEKEFLAEIKLH